MESVLILVVIVFVSLKIGLKLDVWTSRKIDSVLFIELEQVLEEIFRFVSLGKKQDGRKKRRCSPHQRVLIGTLSKEQVQQREVQENNQEIKQLKSKEPAFSL